VRKETGEKIILYYRLYKVEIYCHR